VKFIDVVANFQMPEKAREKAERARVEARRAKEKEDARTGAGAAQRRREERKVRVRAVAQRCGRSARATASVLHSHR
jgi:hypothetical protein